MASSLAPLQAGQRASQDAAFSADETLFRVLVVGAQTTLRTSIICSLSMELNLACCGECQTIAETRSLVGKLAPDLILLDLRLPDGESFELIEWLHRKFPFIPVLVTSESESAVTVTRALTAGASGYLARRETDAPIIQAIYAVLRGERYVDAGFEVLSPEALMSVDKQPIYRDGI